jgi:Protein of unknown function (DUF4256)
MQHPVLATLKARLEAHPARHPGREWGEVIARLDRSPAALVVLARMEATGGEPDVVAVDPDGAMVFVDCAPESPAGRRSLCFDRAALDARKANKPASSAEDMAREIGVSLLDEGQYQALQALGPFDLKTSSWIATPHDVRALGGALFGDRRFGRVFTYHNGADSYYAARGFRGRLVV